MNTIELKAHAKINISLDVLRKRPDGYHDVKMIMQALELHDIVRIEVIEEGIEIDCEHKFVPNNQDNIAYKAAKLIIDTYNIQKGVKIIITKNIPVSAGLAGGSTNAAAVLKGMNQLFSLNIPLETLLAHGKKLCADVPFCLMGGTMLSEGIGEVLSSLPSLKGVSIVLVKPNTGVSTEWVYKSLNLSQVTLHPDTDLLINAINEKDISTICSNLVNVLETVTIEKNDVINEIKAQLIDLGAMGCLMSGSGPTVFGIFKDTEVASHAIKSLDPSWTNILTTTI